jgi:hypothetical protein
MSLPSFSVSDMPAMTLKYRIDIVRQSDVRWSFCGNPHADKTGQNSK